MIDTRLALALNGGGLLLPDSGTIAVVGAPTEADLSILPKDRILIVEGFKPAYDHWNDCGYSCDVTLNARHAAVVISLPRAKADARALIAQAAKVSGGPVVIDGQKTDGIDSILRDLRKRTEVSAPISKAHGKLFWCTHLAAELVDDWAAGPELTAGGFWTAPGVFSADGVDPASALLVQTLPERLGAQVADLGAGWGYLSAHVLTRAEVKSVHLVEANHMALECARRNITDPRAQFHWADAPAWTSDLLMDSVVMNPPFHKGRAADPGLGQSFVRQASVCLSPRGSLWMVANRHLPYETTLQQFFGHVAEIGGDARFKLFHASKPLRKPARRG